MPERDEAGLTPLDSTRADSMADEGGASAAGIERPDTERERSHALATLSACLMGLATGAALVRLLRTAR